MEACRLWSARLRENYASGGSGRNVDSARLSNCPVQFLGKYSRNASPMNVFERMHGDYVQQRRLEKLVRHLEGFIQRDASVADVGCGDGRLAAMLQERRPDLKIEGIDVLKRPRTWIPVRQFDGRALPYEAGEVDVVMLVDVVHHVEQPEQLLREAVRIAKACIVIKDHL